MKNNKNKTFKVVILSFFIIILSIITTFAGTAKIQFSDPKVKRGQSIDLVVKVKSDNVKLSSAEISISYDPNMIEFVGGTNGTTAEGSAGTVKISGSGKGANTKTLEYHVQFDAKQSGNAQVTLLTNEVKDTTDNIVNITHFGQSKITISPANTTSKNTNLKSLIIQPGELDKEFEASVVEYNVDVNSDINSLVISAEPEDSDAKVAINGNENFQIGNNNVIILVTAANNTNTKTYTLHVNKLDTGFTEGDTEYAGSEQRVVGKQIKISILPLPETWYNEFPNYTQTEATLGESATLVNVLGQNDEIQKSNTEGSQALTNFIFYGMGQDGEAKYYRYDILEATVQRYIGDTNSALNDEYKQKYENLYKEYDNAFKMNQILVIALIASLILLFIVVIVLLIKSKTSSNKKYDVDEEEDDDEYYSNDDDDDDDDEYNNTKISNKKKTNKKNKNDYDDDDFDEDDDDIEELV